MLFTDIRMPVMHGLALAQAVHAQYPLVQVVIVSGFADFTYAQQAIHLGVEEYMLSQSNRMSWPPCSVYSKRNWPRQIAGR